MAPIHDRMPVIIAEGDWGQWQHGSADDAQVLGMARAAGHRSNGGTLGRLVNGQEWVACWLSVFGLAVGRSRSRIF